MANDKEAPKIIIKKVHGHHEHEEHGGAWKVAYADFMTAMMAFFLLLWLLSDNQEEKLEGIADYFSPTEVALTSFGGNDVLEGQVLQEIIEQDVDDPIKADSPDQNMPAKKIEVDRSEMNPWEQLADARDEITSEPRNLREAMDALAKLKEEGGPLSDVAENIVLREKNASLLIEILDLEDSPIFESGKATLTENHLRILREVSKAIGSLREDITIVGHTDAVPYRSRTDYSNWELSSDRANATRRALIGFGISEGRMERVAGAADRQPMIETDPFADENRRVTIELSPEFAFVP